MQILTDPRTLQQTCLRWRADGKHTVLVPTMGYYHAGHESLMSYARSLGDKVVVSLFVNPTQFGPGEDLAAYPRDLERDAALAEANGADILFTPQPADMFPAGHATWIEVPSLAGTLCGITRPTHFRGVCTVVMKLFQLAMPRTAVFGQKDWQQLAIIRRMARDLNVPVDVVGRPIVREADGLAMSSRNIYLSTEERAQAPNIHHGLALGRALVQGGERDAAAVAEAMRRYWRENLPLAQEDYISIVHPETLEPLARITDAALCAVAFRLGKARLIDNMLLAGE
ncbi:pantoate--beta-alanine ligase [Nitratidesulfovibrio sp.]|uniref:pantoate--beta-alanine ligase n=1 Tax=Nitratidesulfovibrio sp. TaxID=2802297 RepID=UPI003342A980